MVEYMPTRICILGSLGLNKDLSKSMSRELTTAEETWWGTKRQVSITSQPVHNLIEMEYIVRRLPQDLNLVVLGGLGHLLLTLRANEAVTRQVTLSKKN